MPPEVSPRRMRAAGEGLHSLEYSMNVCEEARGGRGQAGRRKGRRGLAALFCLFKGKSDLWGGGGYSFIFQKCLYISYIQKYL